jgi:acetyl esterase/lipase
MSAHVRLIAWVLHRTTPKVPPQVVALMAPWEVVPERIDVPTRHGTVPCLVYRSTSAGSSPPPVVLHVHGGASESSLWEADRLVVSGEETTYAPPAYVDEVV